MQNRGEEKVTRKIDLSVNDKPVKLDYFVVGYIDHVVGGIIASLKDTGEIKALELTIDNEGQVKIVLNGADIPLGYFPVEIIRNTMTGMAASLKGVDGGIDRLELKITR
jgi:hypothetical protein